MDEQWQEDEVVAKEPTTEEPEKATLEQFCTAFSRKVPVETLSLFYELELEQGNYLGTVEEFQQRLTEFRNRPL